MASVKTRKIQLGTALHILGMQVKSDETLLTPYILHTDTKTVVPESEALYNECVFDGKRSPKDTANEAAERLKMLGVEVEQKAVSKPSEFLMDDNIEAAKRKVRTAWQNDRFKSPFALGDALQEFCEAFNKVNGRDPGQKETKTILAIDLTTQRMSSLQLTAKWFPDGQRDKTIPFKQYEQARKIENQLMEDEKRNRRPLSELIAAIKDGSIFKSKPKGSQQQRLVVTVDADRSSGTIAWKATIKADGHVIERKEHWMVEAARAAQDSLMQQFGNLLASPTLSLPAPQREPQP